MKPRPYFAPTMKAPFFTLGTITAQAALSNRSCGIPLSGADMISLSTSAAALSRFVVSSSLFVRAVDLLIHGPELATSANRAAANTNFVTLIFFLHDLDHFWFLYRCSHLDCRNRLRANLPIGRKTVCAG